MAYSAIRLSTFSSAQTGAAILAKYDGSGTTAEGGDNLSDIKVAGFLRGDYALDIVRKASDGRSSGDGVAILLVGNDGIEWDVAFDNGGTIQMRGGDFTIS